MQNSARIQSIVQQLVDAIVDEITAEARMRTGASMSPESATIAPMPTHKLPSWDMDAATPTPTPTVSAPQPSFAPAPKFETPDFDQLLKDLEELRKPLATKQPVVQDAEVVPQMSADTVGVASMNTGGKPFSGLTGASDLLKRITGK